MSALEDAYDTVLALCGKPPEQFWVGPVAIIVEAPNLTAVLPESTWREIIEERLARVWDGRVPDGLAEVSMRQPNWTFRGVPIDTSRL